MLGHRVSLTGLSTPGWSEHRGRVIGQKDARFLVLLDDGREAFVKDANLLLIQVAGASPQTEKMESPAAQGERTMTQRASQKSFRYADGGSAAGNLARASIPGHARLLFDERQAGKIAAELLRQLSARFHSETIVALQDRQRNIWLLDPANKLTIGRSAQCDVVIKENTSSVSRTHLFLSGSNSAGAFYLTDTSAAGTIVNGLTCHNESVVVRAGDVIHLGTSTRSLAAFILQDFSFSNSHRPIVDLAAQEAKLINPDAGENAVGFEARTPASVSISRRPKNVEDIEHLRIENLRIDPYNLSPGLHCGKASNADAIITTAPSELPNVRKALANIQDSTHDEGVVREIEEFVRIRRRSSRERLEKNPGRNS